MNIQTVPKLTTAETAFVDGFADQFASLPGDAAVARRRDDAVEMLKAGLPTRRVEAWHYTDLRRLLASVPAHVEGVLAQPVQPVLRDSAVLRTLDGIGEDAKSGEGLSIRRVNELLISGELADMIGAANDADAIGAINSAFVTDGYAVEIGANVDLTVPIELQHVHAGGQAHTLNIVDVGAGARATFVERQTGSGTALVSAVSRLRIADGADVTWIIVQEQPDDAVHLGQFHAHIGEKARLTLFVMNSGGKLVRQELHVQAAGEEAIFKLRGINLLAGSIHCDVTMVLDHEGYGAESTEVIRNIVLDQAHGVFQGQIRVTREAQKTDAKMSCNTLLLSDDGEFSAKPELEIFADDVACGHGATVAEIDGDHLFYLMARGIPEKEARGLLVKAFLAEVIEELDNEPLVEALEARLDAWFAVHG